MMTMVERVAQAIAKELGDNWEEPTMFMQEYRDTHETCRQVYRGMARAAIEAMRDPTAMASDRRGQFLQVLDEDGKEVPVTLSMRFHLFAWQTYNARGGYDDIMASYDEIDDAMRHIDRLRGRQPEWWGQIFDTESRTVVFESDMLVSGNGE